ncbi:MAG TPA: hypothetical protein VIN38_05520 [Thiobacillus sp.]
MVIKAPKSSSGDTTHALVKAGLSAIPIVGGPAAEIFQLLVHPPLERRRHDWMTQIGEKLLELESHGLNLEDLQNNEQFISAVMQASAAALRTHKEMKLAALRNAVLHVATSQGPEETIQHLLLSFIDQFSEMHLQILAFARTPKPQSNISAGGLGHVLEDNIPTLRGERTLYDQLWKDLYLRGLVNTESLHVMMTGNGLAQGRTSPLGEALLNFIAEPK